MTVWTLTVKVHNLFVFVSYNQPPELRLMYMDHNQESIWKEEKTFKREESEVEEGEREDTVDSALPTVCSANTLSPRAVSLSYADHDSI